MIRLLPPPPAICRSPVTSSSSTTRMPRAFWLPKTTARALKTSQPRLKMKRPSPETAQSSSPWKETATTTASRAKPTAISAPTAPAATPSTPRNSPKRALPRTTPTGWFAPAPARWAALKWKAARQSSAAIASGWNTTTTATRPTACTARPAIWITHSSPSSSIRLQRV